MKCIKCSKECLDSELENGVCVDCRSNVSTKNSNNIIEKQKNGFATASLALGIIGVCTSFIPIINNISFILALISIMFGIIPLLQKEAKNIAVTGIILSILTIVVTIKIQALLLDNYNNIANEFDDSIGTITGSQTEKILENYLDVTFGDFNAVKDEFGILNTTLPITIKNKGSERKSFNITIEAIDKNGTRIETDSIYVDSLAPGQKQYSKVFTYIDNEKIKSLKKATFEVVEISMY